MLTSYIDLPTPYIDILTTFIDTLTPYIDLPTPYIDLLTPYIDFPSQRLLCFYFFYIFIFTDTIYFFSLVSTFLAWFQSCRAMVVMSCLSILLALGLSFIAYVEPRIKGYMISIPCLLAGT